MDVKAMTANTPSIPAPTDTKATQTVAKQSATPLQTSAAVREPDDAENLKQVDDAVKKINHSIQENAQGLEFSVDRDNGRIIVKVVDQETKEVLRQMPSKEALDIAKSLDRTMGLLIKQKA